MAELSKKDFAELCSIKTKDLSIYIRRGKVLVSGDMVDTMNPTNVYFMEGRERLMEKKEAKKGDAEAVRSGEDALNKRVADKKNTKEPEINFDIPAPNAEPSAAYLIDNKIKTQELEKSKLQTLLLEAKLEKISGDSIPTELVKNMMLHHSKSITIAFENGMDNWLMMIAKKMNIGIKEMAEFRKELVPVINEAVKSSIEMSKNTIKNIIAEHSQKKEVGEQDSR